MSSSNVTNDTKLKTVKDDNAISGFAAVLKKRMITDGCTWDLTIGAVEHLDFITDSSPGLSFAVLVIIDPKAGDLITFDKIKELSKEGIIADKKVKNLFELYSAFEKEGLIGKIFKR